MPIVLVCALVLLVGGCQSSQRLSNRGERPASINHIVFMTLEDESLIPDLINACDAELGTIPSVVSYFAGTHYDIGRDSILQDYDVGLYLGFASEEGLRRYVEHERHVAFVARWRPRLTSLRVYDVGDPTP